MAQAAHDRALPEESYGLPLQRARWCFVGAELWKPALIASIARASAAYSDRAGGSVWRYEVFTVPADPPVEQSWERWAAQELDPAVQAEVARQNTHYDINLGLGRRLIAGELSAYGRQANMVGEWTPIPAAAWRRLRVTYDPGFRNWIDGQVAGAGMEFWGVRIRDNLGLGLADAAIAYGRPADAELVQRAIALGRVPPATTDPQMEPEKRGNLDALMAGQSFDLGPQGKPTEADFTASRERLGAQLFAAIVKGELVATGVPEDGQVREIPLGVWSQGWTDYWKSAVTGPNGNYSNIVVRPRPLDFASTDQAPDPGPVPLQASTSTPGDWKATDVEQWFVTWVDRHESEARHPSEETDWAAADAEFPGVPRKTIRSLRDQYVPKARRKQGPKPQSAKLPK